MVKNLWSVQKYVFRWTNRPNFGEGLIELYFFQGVGRSAICGRVKSLSQKGATEYTHRRVAVNKLFLKCFRRNNLIYTFRNNILNEAERKQTAFFFYPANTLFSPLEKL